MAIKEPPSKFWRFVRALFFYPIFGLLLAWPLSSFIPIPFVFCWLIAINIFGIIAMGKDKIAAQFEWQFTMRTQLSVVYLIGFIGGFPGIFLGQNLFNHRTQEKLLTTVMWSIFIIQLALAFLSVTDSFKETINKTFQNSEGQTAAEYFNFSDKKAKPAPKTDDYYKKKPAAPKKREKTAAEMLFGDK